MKIMHLEKKHKTFIFFDSIENIYKFIYCGSFNELARFYDLHFLILKTDDICNCKGIITFLRNMGLKLYFFKFYPKRHDDWIKLFYMNCYCKSNKNYASYIHYHNYSKQVPSIAKTIVDFYYDSNEYLDFISNKNGLHPDIYELVKIYRPSFFILPSNILDKISGDVLQIANKLAIPTILLQAGWDNLCSKGYLPYKPDYICCWGEQSKQHAVQYQQFSDDKIFLIGAPHYKGYGKFNKEKQDTNRKNSFFINSEKTKVLLFAGMFRNFNEVAILNNIELNILKKKLPPTKIIYRPHPSRNNTRIKKYLSAPLENITVDINTNIKLNWENYILNSQKLLDLYMSVDGIICPMSTIIIEGMYWGISSLVISFNDKINDWGADIVGRMPHCNEIRSIKELAVVTEEADFINKLNAFILDATKYSKNLFQKRDLFVCGTSELYSQNLLCFIKTIFG